MPSSLCIPTLCSPVFKGPSCICCTLGLILLFCYSTCDCSLVPISCAPKSFPNLDFVCPPSPSGFGPGGLWVSPLCSTWGSSGPPLRLYFGGPLDLHLCSLTFILVELLQCLLLSSGMQHDRPAVNSCQLDTISTPNLQHAIGLQPGVRFMTTPPIGHYPNTYSFLFVYSQSNML